MPTKSKAVSPKDSSAHPGFEAKLWLNAEKLRNNMDAAEPGGVRQKMRSTARRVSEANQYEAGIFFLGIRRCTLFQASTKLPTTGKTVDDALVAIERDIPRIKGVLPNDGKTGGIGASPISLAA